MKRLVLLISLIATAASLRAEQSFILYGKGDYSLVSATSPTFKPSDQARAGFLADVQADLGQPDDYDTHMALKAPPAREWGKVIPAAQGKFAFHESFKGGFLVHVRMDGLTPGHTYRLTLNGNPKLAGNDLLPDPVKNLPEERYYDFFTVAADAAGRVDAKFAIALKPGAYDVRLYVKDTTDFTIFLYHDYFRFTVE